MQGWKQHWEVLVAWLSFVGLKRYWDVAVGWVSTAGLVAADQALPGVASASPFVTLDLTLTLMLKLFMVGTGLFTFLLTGLRTRRAWIRRNDKWIIGADGRPTTRPILPKTSTI